MKKMLTLMAFAAASLCGAGAHADQLDDIISAGKLRCAVELDFPPNGSRDADNKPIGFDVDYCNDLGKALGVQVEIVDTPDPDRIPAVLSGRADLAIAVASDTLERAKSVSFSIPYFVFRTIVLVREELQASRARRTSRGTPWVARQAHTRRWPSRTRSPRRMIPKGRC